MDYFLYPLHRWVVVTVLVQWEGLFHLSQVAGNNTCTGIPWAHPSLEAGIANALLQRDRKSVV